MTAVLAVEIAALALLLACSAFFSSAETALFSLNPIQIHRLRKTNPGAADRIQALLGAPTRLLSTILVGNTLVNVTASGIGYAIAEHFLPGRGQAVAIPAMTVLLLLLGEVTPKRHAVGRAERLAAAYTYVLPALVRAAAPVRALMEFVVRPLRKDLGPPSRSLSEDEFLSVVEAGEEQGLLKAEERSMVDGIIRLEDMQARDVMTPRVDLIGVDLDDPPEAWVKTAVRVQFRHLPIYRRFLDRAEGFLDVARFLADERHDPEAARIAPFFVPETAPLDQLLLTFQREQRSVAFVADEYGGTAGLVTLGDILEEIVGEVEDEYVAERLTIQKMRDNLWIVDGSTSLEEINYALDTRLEADGVGRISGWIAARTGRIPHTGEAIEAQGCRVTVHRTRRTRVVTVFVEKLDPEPPAGEKP
jgi:CBS domain containing-hemolysin-like protein